MIKKTLFVLLGAVILLGFVSGCKPKEPDIEEVVDTTAVEISEAPVCQSCAMPLTKPEDFGTMEDGSPSKDYCAKCYQDGKFTSPEMTIDDMVEALAPNWAEWTENPDLTIDEARAEVHKVLSGLKRWKEQDIRTS